MKKSTNVLKRNRILLMFFIILLGYVGYVTIQTEIKYRELKAEETILNEKLNQLNEDKQELSKQLEESQSLDTIERIAREKLKMVKPNEILYMIQEDEKK